MADANWRVGNTRPAVLITLDLGIDPVTLLARTLAVDDVVTQIIRNQTTPGAAIVRTLTIEDAAANQALYDPAVGDLDVAGTYKVMFDITDVNDDVESIPDTAAADYSYLVGERLDA